MSVLAKLLKNNRICVTVAVIIAIIANLSQMIYIVYIGELVNRIENREKVTSNQRDGSLIEKQDEVKKKFV